MEFKEYLKKMKEDSSFRADSLELAYGAIECLQKASDQFTNTVESLSKTYQNELRLFNFGLTLNISFTTPDGKEISPVTACIGSHSGILDCLVGLIKQFDPELHNRIMKEVTAENEKKESAGVSSGSK